MFYQSYKREFPYFGTLRAHVIMSMPPVYPFMTAKMKFCVPANPHKHWVFRLGMFFYSVAVSTKEQAQEGFSIRAQEQKLKDYARIKDWSIFNIYMDEGFAFSSQTLSFLHSRLVFQLRQQEWVGLPCHD